jgi:spoIIIJ-associated protein
MNETLKTIVLELLRQMGFVAEVFERQEEGRMVLNIKPENAQLLIGKQGANLDALQHVIRIMYRKATGEETFPFALDIDDYKDQRTLYLKDLARRAAAHVRQTQKPVSLEPMPAHERRVVHSYLSLYSDVSTESIGREPQRKLVIRPKQKEKSADGFDFLENS